MRPQLNVSLDEYPELPEKIRKLCKVRGYKISDFCARVLNAAIEKEVAEIAGNTSEPSTQVSVEVIEELRAKLEKYERQIDNLNDAMVESLPKLNNDVWLLRQMVFDCAEPLVSRVQQLEELRNNSELAERLNQLSDELPRLIEDILTLKEATRVSGEPLLERVEKLEALISELRTDMEELKKPKVRSEDDLTTPADSPQFKCSLCDAIGLIGRNFKPSGSDKGKKRYMCLSCGRKPNNLIEVK